MRPPARHDPARLEPVTAAGSNRDKNGLARATRAGDRSYGIRSGGREGGWSGVQVRVSARGLVRAPARRRRGGRLAACGLRLAAPGCGPCEHQVYPNPAPSVASPAAVASAAGAPAPGTRAEGSQFARAELALVRLPAGARVTPAPPLVMQRPPLFGWQMGEDMTSAGGTVWRLPLSAADAVAYFRRDPPAGWQVTLLDASGRMSGSVGGAVNTVLVYGRGPAPPPGVWAAQVLVSLHPDGPGASLARVDVQVGWFGARSAAEYIAGFAAM